MASFRTGFKIFGEISLKQGLGRIRSFSEDRKPGQWLPEDQWAVRKPGSTCHEPCDKPPKPPKPSKSWLSICKDPEPPITCDVRHNNCPPPPPPKEGPWYSLDNLMPKKKQEKAPPLQSCREEMQRREICGEKEEVCEKMVDKKELVVDIKPEPHESCMPKQEPCPAPVVTLSCPLPKELDLMVWCGKPSRNTSRIAANCQSDKLPYQEFRPQNCWKPPPFSLPVRSDPSLFQSACCNVGSIAFSEFKQVEVPKPLYTRYKSVDLTDRNFSFCMIDAKCPDDKAHSMASYAPSCPPLPNPLPPVKVDKRKEFCPEKPVIEAASCKPVRIKKAPKYTYRPKPTKLIERRVCKNPCAQHKNSDLTFRHPDGSGENECPQAKQTQDCEPPKVLTGTLTDEPQMYDRHFLLPSDPPSWMYVLCKPGSKDTPLIPACEDFPKEPDWCSETDGLNFYDNNNESITPKPPPDPCLAEGAKPKIEEPPPPPPPEPTPPVETHASYPVVKNRFVLMPEQYCIKYTRPEISSEAKEKIESTFEKFIEGKTPKISLKSYPPMKENILYDLQRLCPNVPVDPSKLKPPCRKPPEPDCPQPTRFYRSFSTFTANKPRYFESIQLYKTQRRTECGDSSGKCKAQKLVPKQKECPEKPKPPDCAEITLPCCPKARIPPNCNMRRNLPPCKKKLAPKPSFSECSKDPPPCPKMTECNCWEKKPGKNGS